MVNHSHALQGGILLQYWLDWCVLTECVFTLPSQRYESYREFNSLTRARFRTEADASLADYPLSGILKVDSKLPINLIPPPHWDCIESHSEHSQFSQFSFVWLCYRTPWSTPASG